jgi:flagellar basal-body rod modification protein FlgD
MSSIPATSAPTSAATSATTSSNPSIGLTSNQFLSLLTTQLQAQDPLNPTDPNQFTTEMVQYASLSEQIDTNSKLDTLNSNFSGLLTQVSLLASAGGAASQA